MSDPPAQVCCLQGPRSVGSSICTSSLICPLWSRVLVPHTLYVATVTSRNGRLDPSHPLDLFSEMQDEPLVAL